MKQCGRGSAFPHKRDPVYRRWIRSMGCLIWGAALPRAISLNDEPAGRGFTHRCWGPMDPAHVGQHQATGAPDRGAVVCLCRAAHKWYDERRSQFAKVTGLTDKKLENIAAGLGLKYVEQGR